MGAAPTLPGIRDMFSAPPKLLSIAHITKSCQDTPAPTLTKAQSSSSLKISIPSISFFKTVPSKSLVSKMLLPPPSTNNGSFSSLSKDVN